MDRSLLAEYLRNGLSLEAIGRRMDRDPSTVRYWLTKYGLEPVNSRKYAARGALERAELEALVAAGRSIREIAAEVDRSPATIRHWLRRYELSTDQACRLRLYGREEKYLMLDCPRHGRTRFHRRSTGGYRCLKCRSDAVSGRRRRVKQRLVEEAGGACEACGYDRCIGALHFHHLDPTEKIFSLSHRGVSRSLAKARGEAAKCMLLCGNCHAEVEAGMRSLPGRPVS
jgi:transposase